MKNNRFSYLLLIIIIFSISCNNEKRSKPYVLNLGGPRKNGDNPAALNEFVTSGIDAILIDHSLDFENYIESLKW